MNNILCVSGRERFSSGVQISVCVTGCPNESTAHTAV